MAQKEKKKMQIGELSRKSGVASYTIRYYVKKGLLHPPVKTGKTRAYYDQSHLERLLAIKEIRRDFNSPLSFVKKELGEENTGEQTPKPLGKTMDRRRKLSQSHLQKKERILDAAIELFSRQGYHRTNIKDVTDYLGISTGTFYIYFEGKSDLFLQVVDRVVKNTIDRVGEAIAHEQDLVKVMYLRSKAFNRGYANLREIMAQLQAESASMGDQGEKRLKEIHQELISPLIHEINQAMEQKLIREVDPELLALSFLALTEMICYRLTWDNKYTFEQLYSFTFDLNMNGLRPENVD